MRKEHWPVFVAVLLIALSNAIKGGAGLYYLDERPLNLAASILLSVGAEILLFYALMRWSADRTVAAGIYSLAISAGAVLLNWLFFRSNNNIDVLLSVALAAVGPGIASIGGLVVGEVERTEKRELEDTRLYDIRKAELELEKVKQEKLIALHGRRAAEAQKPVVVQAQRHTGNDDQIKDAMLERFARGLSLQAISRELEPSYGKLHKLSRELIAEGQLEKQGNRLIPTNGRHP